MKQTLSKCFSVVCVACLFFGAAGGVRAGGFKIQDQSARAMGMIDAFVAGADDASAVYYNPAGLTYLSRPQLVGNLYFAHAEMIYDGMGGRERSDGRIYALPNLFLGIPLSESSRWVAGLGVYSPFGLGTKWGDDSLVRYYTTLSEISLVNINPTLAVKVSERLALGVGLNYYGSRFKIRRANDNPFDLPDGKTVIQGEGDGWGGNLGLVYQATETVRLGLTYRSRVGIDYDGTLKVRDTVVPSAFPPGYSIANSRYDIDTEIIFPAMISGGVMWQATPRLRLEFACEFQQWSARDTQVLSVDGGSALFPGGQIRQPLNWRDSWVLMLGTEYALSDRWTLRGGYAFNESPVPAKTADPSLPPGDTHAASLGVGCKLTENLALDAACVVSYQERARIRGFGAPLGSRYKTWGGYASIGLTWTF